MCITTNTKLTRSGSIKYDESPATTTTEQDLTISNKRKISPDHGEAYEEELVMPELASEGEDESVEEVKEERPNKRQKSIQGCIAPARQEEFEDLSKQNQHTLTFVF